MPDIRVKLVWFFAEKNISLCILCKSSLKLFDVFIVFFDFLSERLNYSGNGLQNFCVTLAYECFQSVFLLLHLRAEPSHNP